MGVLEGALFMEMDGERLLQKTSGCITANPEQHIKSSPDFF